MRDLMHTTFGKATSLPVLLAMQERRPPNRRRPYGFTADELERIQDADAKTITDLRELAIKCMDLTARAPK